MHEYEDRFRLRTPEGVDLDLTLAGVGSRFTAAIVDLLLQGMIVLALAIALLGGTAFLGETTSALGAAIFFIGYFLVIFGYDILFEVFASGRTPGKRWTGLRVVRVGGQPVGFVTSAIRNLLRIVDILPGLYAVGTVAILVTSKNQRVGDLAAGTLVVRDRTGISSQDVARREQARAGPAETPATAWDVTAVGAEEVAAVRSFLDRRWDLEPGARSEVARTLAHALQSKVGGYPDYLGPESFLEQLAAQKAARET